MSGAVPKTLFLSPLKPRGPLAYGVTMEYLSFRLPEDFVEHYADERPACGSPIGSGNSLG